MNVFKNSIIESSVLLLMAASLPVWGAAPATPAPPNAPAAAKPATPSLFGNTVVAKGKGVEVTRAQLDDKVIRLKAQAAGRGQNIPPEHVAMLDQQMLDQLIQIQLLQGKATPEEIGRAH